MNPLKCAFGVTSEKFLGFIIRHQWIEIDQFKIDAIQKMSRPKSLYDLRVFRDDWFTFEGSSPTWSIDANLFKS